jgi:hypothetical protein
MFYIISFLSFSNNITKIINIAKKMSSVDLYYYLCKLSPLRPKMHTKMNTNALKKSSLLIYLSFISFFTWCRHLIWWKHIRLVGMISFIGLYWHLFKFSPLWQGRCMKLIEMQYTVLQYVYLSFILFHASLREIHWFVFNITKKIKMVGIIYYIGLYHKKYTQKNEYKRIKKSSLLVYLSFIYHCLPQVVR